MNPEGVADSADWRGNVDDVAGRASHKAYGRSMRSVLATCALLAVVIASAAYVRSAQSSSHLSVTATRRWWPPSSRAALKAQLAAYSIGRGRQGEDGGHESEDSLPSMSMDELAYGQWFRAQSIKKWFGVASPGHAHDITDKMKYITRLDCAAAVEYHIEHVAKDCRFPCGPCEGATFIHRCGLLHEGYCADCGGCPVDFYRQGCGGPSVAIELEYDPEQISDFKDVMNTYLNTTDLQGRCEPCGSCVFGQYRIECYNQSAGFCTPCEQCAEGSWRDECAFTNPGVCRDCEVCPAGEFIPDCRYMNKGSCRACTTCNASEYTLADCTGTEDRVCASCEDLPLCAPGFFREGCGGGAEGQCVPCHATPTGFFRVECGASGETAGGLVVREPGYPLSGGHAVECEACEPEHFRNGCGGADTPLQPGSCQRCEDCGRGNWRDGCGTASSAVISPGVCKPCQVCGDNLFVVGCEYLSPGECRDCMQCDATQYTVRECSNEADRICGPCTALPACPEGEYREGCGLGNEGQCTACPVPPVGFYHVECGGLNAGRDVRCGECAEGEFNYNCKGNNEGSCEACGACSAGEYRLNCGTWIDPGHCEPCLECPGGHYLIGCGGMSAGSCTPCYVCAHDEYETMPCSNRQNRECSKCAQLPPCEVGQYRADCGFGSEGECRICGECPPGSIRQGCGGDQPGTCAACGECPEGQFRFGCADGQPGECRDCADCPDGSYRVGCKGQEEGHCEPCSQCGEHEYEGRVCSGTGLQQHDRQCLTCDSLTCAPGSYRKGCGNNPEGICTLCPDTCGEGQFRVGCENEQEGVCGPCALDCPEDQYRKGCQYLDPGQCTDCAVCPEGYFSKGCGGLHAGACLACDSLPCPPNMERTQCGGKSEGYCDQIWLSYTPPPEPILWAEWLTDNPTPECIDNGGNDIPGVTRNFHMPNSLLRLGACRQATASGSYTLKATGKWMVNFYVGIPTFDSKPGAVAPAAYPMQDEGKPDPSDTLEVTLCGGKAGDICVTQTFENKLDGGFEDNKHVFYHTIDSMETTTLHFKFTWKSSNIKDHLHLFASTGTAVFLGDKLPISKAVAYAESHLAGLGEGEGNLEGAIENAIDGNKLAPKKNVKTGYKIHRKTIRLALPDREADFQMFVGSSKLYEPTVQKGAYESVIAAGKYACQASFPGFYTAFDPVCVVDGSKDRKHSMVLCPYLNPGHGRFILTWGEKPQDMDLYLDAPDGQGGRCTVMWKRANKFCQQVGKSREAARIHLDLDVTDGYGPETITVEGFVPGEYLLRVKHYRGSSCVDRRTNFDKCLADSGAMVSFYMDDRQFRFEISKGHGYTAGIQWVIAKINGATREVTMCTPSLCPPILDESDSF